MDVGSEFVSSETEEWRTIEGTDGLYEVSSLGRVRSWWSGEPRIMSTPLNGAPKGNYRIFRTSSRGGQSVSRRVHTEVCKAFHGQRPEWAEVVRHLDGDNQNNRASNLAWGTQKENVADTFRHGYKAWAKLSHDDVRAIRSSRARAVDLAARYGVSKGLIHGVRTGRLRKDVL